MLKGQLTLGSTLTIKAGNTKVEDKVLKTTTEYKSDNIRTAYVQKNNELLIGIKENPTFKKVSLEAEQTYNSDPSKNKVDKKELITKGYLDGALQTSPQVSRLREMMKVNHLTLIKVIRL